MIYDHVSQFNQLSPNEQKRVIARAILQGNQGLTQRLTERIARYAKGAGLSLHDAILEVRAECITLIDKVIDSI